MIKVHTILDIYRWDLLKENIDENIMLSVYNEIKRLLPHCDIMLVPTKTTQQDNKLITIEQSLQIFAKKTNKILFNKVVWTRSLNTDLEHLHIK